MKTSVENLKTRVSQRKYITGRNSKSFTDLEEAKKYADKWRDKSISVYQDGKYHSTIHLKDEIINF